MVDLIAAVILSTFGGGMAVIVAGFYIVTRRKRDSPFRTEDYANYVHRPGRQRYSPQDFLRKDPEIVRRAKSRRALYSIILVLFLVVAAIASTFSDPIDLLLFLVLLSPFLLSLLRVRRKEKDRERNSDDLHSS